MDITCDNCQARFNIPDHKIPTNKKASFLCPKCKQRIHLSFDSNKTSIKKNPEIGEYDASDKPFDFLDKNTRTALVCMADNDSKAGIENFLKKMDFYLQSPKNAGLAVTSMKYHLFDLVILDELFDEKGQVRDSILNFIEKLDMVQRRSMFLMFISNTIRTMDKMAAFHKSVNLIINRNDLDNMEKILKAGLDGHGRFYTVFNESLKKTGRA
ncbi:MAG: zinc-ribbon domain-containing protein [Thermodesulfobacteriota bacterium]|nr:zinc-ribbon domain-containing protein [Thermodesulfobacteriota bacterium]